MKRSRFSEEQIIGVLKEHQAGLSAAQLGRKHGVSEPTFYKVHLKVWRHRRIGREAAEGARGGERRAEEAPGGVDA